MIRLAIALAAATALTAPALAQHHGHHMPAPSGANKPRPNLPRRSAREEGPGQ
jgi:hypothetical protein